MRAAPRFDCSSILISVESLPPALEDLLHLVARDSIQAAAEGGELHEGEPAVLRGQRGGCVETGVISPLVDDTQGPVDLPEVRNRILREDRHPQGDRELRDAVVDLGVQVIGAAGKNHAEKAAALDVPQRFFSLSAHFRAEGCLLGQPGVHRVLHLGPGHAGPGKLLRQALLQAPGVVEGKEGVCVADRAVPDPVHVVQDHLGIRGHDGTVEMIPGARVLAPAVRQARVEDEGHSFLEEPADVPVHELARVADGLGRDCLHPRLVECPGGAGRKAHGESQPGKDGEPERVVLVEIEHPGDAHDSARSLVSVEGLVAEQPCVFPCEEIGKGLALWSRRQGASRARAPFAAVAGNERPAVGEPGDREQAVVLAGPAALQRNAGAQALQRGEPEHPRARVRVRAGAREERRAVGAHQARDVGPHGFTPRDELEGPRHGIVEERASLDDDLLPELPRIPQADDLLQRVPDDGIGEARGNLGHRRAFLLGLLDPRVHEHGAPRAQVHGGGRAQGLSGKITDPEAQRLREGLQERAAPRGAGLVQENGGDGPVANTHELHVLAADVQDGLHAGQELGGGREVRHRLHLSVVQPERRLDEGLAVAGGARPGNPCVGRQGTEHLLRHGDGISQGVAAIARV